MRLHPGHMFSRRLNHEPLRGDLGPALRQYGLEFALTQVLVLRQLHDDVAPRPAHRHHGLGAATGERVLDGGHTAGLQLVGNDLLRGRISRFSLDALVNIVATLGQRVNVELEVE